MKTARANYSLVSLQANSSYNNSNFGPVSSRKQACQVSLLGTHFIVILIHNLYCSYIVHIYTVLMKISLLANMKPWQVWGSQWRICTEKQFEESLCLYVENGQYHESIFNCTYLIVIIINRDHFVIFAYLYNSYWESCGVNSSPMLILSPCFLYRRYRTHSYLGAAGL